MKYSNEQKKQIGNRIKSIRTSLGLTMSQFGDRVADAPQSIVSRWESGKSVPSAERLKIISKLGHTDTNWILNGEGYGLADSQLIISKLLEIQESDGTVTANESPYSRAETLYDTITASIKHKTNNNTSELLKHVAILLDIFSAQTQFYRFKNGEIDKDDFDYYLTNVSESLQDDIGELFGNYYGGIK